MNLFLRKLTISILLHVSIVSIAFAETEPNNSLAQANVLTLSQPITGELSSGDEDWFTVTIPDDGALTFSFFGVSGLLANNLTLYSTDGTAIKTGSYGTTCEVSVPNLAQGTYYVRIPHYTGSGSYTLLNTFVSATYVTDNEPNDIVDAAQFIAVQDSITGRLYYNNNNVYDLVDWYAITLPDNGRITINVQAESTLMVNNLQIYDVNKTSVLSTGSYGNSASVTSNNLLAGIYYVKIPRYTGYGSYYIKTIFTQADLTNDTEPNNSILTAQGFGLNDSITGQLYYMQNGVYDTEDWFSVTIPDDGKLSFTVICESTLMVNNLQIYDKDTSTFIVTGSYGATATVSYPNLTAGTYYVKVPRYSGYGSYVLKNEFIPATYVSDSYENENIKSAQQINLNDSITGRLYYRNVSKFDTEDWYSVTIPDDGKLSFNVICESTLMVNNLQIYDKDTSTFIVTGSYGATAVVSYPNLTAGTYFVKVPRYTGYGSYVLKNEFIPATYVADSVSNDSIRAAQQINLNDTVTGRLYYRNVSKFDTEDWYSVTIPDDGKLSFNVICESTLMVNNLQIYDKDTSTFIVTGSYGATAVVSYPNLTAGTYFVKVPRYTGYGSYVLKNEFIPATYVADSVSNDSIQAAHLIQLNDTITGRLYYRNVASFDTQDWYMVVLPKKGNVSFTVSTVDGLQVDNLRIYHKNKTTQLATGNYGVTASVSLLKTSEDTLYLQVSRWSGYGSYELKTTFLPAPTAQFTLFQNLYDIATVNKSVLADTYIWNFGDNNTSTEASAKHTYIEPGTYTVEMIATNAAGSDTVNQVIEILGIRDFAPHIGGNTGDVTISVYGGGFRDDTKVWIEKNGEKILPDTTMLVDRGVIRGTFNLRGKSVGLYDIVVQINNGPILRKDASFEIEQGEFATPWVSIVGRDRILFNRWQTFSVTYGNTSNVDATGVPLWILLPRGDGIEIDFSQVKMSIPITTDTIWKYMYDSLPPYIDIENYQGEPFKGRLYPLFIPFIAAGETHTIKFRLKTPEDIQMYAWVSPPYFQSPVNEDVASCIRWAQAKAVLNGMVSILNEQLSGAACLNSVLQTLYDLKYADPKPITSHLWAMSRATFTCASQFYGPLKAYKISVAVIELGLDIYDGAAADNECRKPKPDPKKPEKEKKGPFDDQPTQKQKIRAVSSFDPNEMVGPRGFTNKNYVSKNIDYNYSIYFENKATATAPATEVLVIDTLDKNVFDFSTFNLNFVNFGDTTISIPQGGTEFTTDVDLRPKLPVVVRISAQFDTTSGVAKWHYVALDTLNFEVNEDPDAGFLPPNTIAPEGEGIVGFTVKLHSEIGENVAISNKATIYFDANPPIVTNEYVNYIDESIPSSEMNALLLTENSPVVPLSWTASDDLSGVSTYTVMVSKNEEPYQTLLGNTSLKNLDFIVEPGNTYKFLTTAIDSVGNKEPLTKSFDAILDVPLSVNKPIVYEHSVSVSPNPISSLAQVRFSTSKKADVEISVISQTGILQYSKVYRLQAGTHIKDIDLSSLSNGVYVLSISSENQHRTFQIIKSNL